MSRRDAPESQPPESGARGVLARFFLSVARDLVQLFLAFAIGVGGAAVVCWYYQLPLVLSLAGGIAVLGLALAVKSDSLFD